ncbi:MAG: hypothetical protein QOE53_2715 [Pseudonocardiales bacterium]|nr:hypothetical protein [Pseudonocardiales bacterium]
MIISSHRLGAAGQAQAGPAQQGGPPVFRRRGLAVLLGATVVLSAACSSARGSDTPAGASAAPASTAPATAAPSDTGSSAASSAPTTAAPSSATPPATTPVSPAPATVSRVAGCATSALTVVALRGSGAAGHQYAFLQFTNSSAKPCSLTGFPGVQLLRGAALLGRPATRANKPAATVALAPGRSATARLVDDSTCNAEKSDSVQIYPPNRTEKVVVPLSIRGCALTIDPVIPS